MLKLSFDAQTDIPQPFLEHYVEKEGKWLLQTDPPAEDVTGLKTALNTERGLRRDAEKQLTEAKVKFEGIEPEEVQRLRDRVKGLDDADVYDKQGIEVLVAKRTDSMKAEHQRVMDTKERELAQLKATAATLDQRWRQDRIKTALLEAVTESKVEKYAVSDAVQRGIAVFTDLDDEGNVIARNGEDVRYGKDGVHPLTPKEWYMALKTSGEAPHFWGSSSGGGAPAHHGANGQGTDWSKITDPAERLARYREATGQQA